jgi:hypothetical protein
MLQKRRKELAACGSGAEEMVPDRTRIPGENELIAIFWLVEGRANANLFRILPKYQHPQGMRLNEIHRVPGTVFASLG